MGKRYQEPVNMVKCAFCGIEYQQSQYSALCDAIGNRKPACGYECNKALGQVTVKGTKDQRGANFSA